MVEHDQWRPPGEEEDEEEEEVDEAVSEGVLLDP